MKISLAQAIQLISQLNTELRNKQEERLSSSVITFLRGEEYKTNDDVDKYTDEIFELRDRVRELRVKTGKVNIETLITIDNNEQISLSEALILVQQIRKELEDVVYFSRLRKQPQLGHSYGSTEPIYKVANVEPDEYKKLAKELGKNANRISTDIDKANHNTMIEVSWADEYIA